MYYLAAKEIPMRDLAGVFVDCGQNQRGLATGCGPFPSVDSVGNCGAGSASAYKIPCSIMFCA